MLAAVTNMSLLPHKLQFVIYFFDCFEQTCFLHIHNLQVKSWVIWADEGIYFIRYYSKYLLYSQKDFSFCLHIIHIPNTLRSLTIGIFLDPKKIANSNWTLLVWYFFTIVTWIKQFCQYNSIFPIEHFFLFNLLWFFSISETSEWFLFVKNCTEYWDLHIILYLMWFLFKEIPGGCSQHMHPLHSSHTYFLLDLYSSHTSISNGLIILITFIWR